MLWLLVLVVVLGGAAVTHAQPGKQLLQPTLQATETLEPACLLSSDKPTLHVLLSTLQTPACVLRCRPSLHAAPVPGDGWAS